MCKTPVAYLQHILEECNYICSVVTDDLPMYQFLSDETLKRAGFAVVWRSSVRRQRKSLRMLSFNGAIFIGSIWQV